MENHGNSRERLLHALGRQERLKGLLPPRLRSFARRVLAGRSNGTIELEDGAKLQYPLTDYYWFVPSADIRSYEPEMWFVADTFLKPGTAFIDGGANIGLWSCVAAAKIKNPAHVIAVEPNEAIVTQLRHNQALNAHGFTVLPQAIWKEDGTRTFNITCNHPSSSLVQQNEKEILRRVPVATTRIDTIVEQYLSKNRPPERLVIKLDVEGAEREALEGASHTVTKRDALLIFEDHGKDRASLTTDYFLKKGLQVYFVNNTGRLEHIISPGQISRHKTQSHQGYNLLACARGTSFHEALEERCGKIVVAARERKPSHAESLPHRRATPRLGMEGP